MAKGSAEEQVFLNESNVTVSSTRFMVGSAMYPINGITSVTAIRIPPPRTWIFILGLMGILVCFANPVVGAVMAVVAVLLFVLLRPKFVVRIATAGGQVDALESKNESQIVRVTTALHDAVANRG